MRVHLNMCSKFRQLSNRPRVKPTRHEAESSDTSIKGALLPSGEEEE